MDKLRDKPSRLAAAAFELHTERLHELLFMILIPLV
jgi:hypothetical protein